MNGALIALGDGRGIVAELVAHAAELTGLPAARIRSERRDAETCWVRNAIVYVARERRHRRLVAIGRVLGGRDHKTILNSVRRAKEALARDPDFRALCSALAGDEPAGGAALAALADEPLTGEQDLFGPGPLFDFAEREALAA